MSVLNVTYHPCCRHCCHDRESEVVHPYGCAECGVAEAVARRGDPYVEEADANPERAENGCMIFRRSS